MSWIDCFPSTEEYNFYGKRYFCAPQFHISWVLILPLGDHPGPTHCFGWGGEHVWAGASCIWAAVSFRWD
jgi:hypothetical protein